VDLAHTLFGDGSARIRACCLVEVASMSAEVRIRFEVGNRVVELGVTTRAEALKAFKLVCDGVLDHPTRANAWHQICWTSFIIHTAGESAKICAVKNFCEITGIPLSDSKAIIESGYYVTDDRETARRVYEQAIKPFTVDCSIKETH
jgi:ribosomal protein L7/L12